MLTHLPPPTGSMLAHIAAQSPAFLPTSSTCMPALFAFHLTHVLTHLLSSATTMLAHTARTLALTPILIPYTLANTHTHTHTHTSHPPACMCYHTSFQHRVTFNFQPHTKSQYLNTNSSFV